MILEAIYLKNIRSYKSVDIDLQKGISLFEGDVGSGKSTILMAIEFAFFGLGNQRGESLLRKDEVKGEVVLNFEVEGISGIIKRTLNRSDLNGKVSQGKGMLFWDGEKMELSPAELKEMVLDIIDFKEDVNPRANSHIFRYAVYTPQEEMKDIINQKPDARMQTLRKAFGIEEYKTAAENANLVLRELKEKQSFISGKMERYDSLESELTELRNDINIDEETLGDLVEVKVDAEEKFENIKGDVEKSRELTNKQKSLKLKLRHNEELRRKADSNLENGNKTLENMINYKKSVVLKRINQFKDLSTVDDGNKEKLLSKIETVEGLISRKIDAEAKRDLLEDQAESIISKMGNYADKSYARLHKEKEKLTEKLDTIEEKGIKCKERFSYLDTDIRIIESEEKEIEERLDSLDSISGTCPTCGTIMTEDKKEAVIEAMHHDLHELKKQKTEKLQEKDKIKHNIKQLTETKADIRERREKFKCLEKEAMELEKKEKILETLNEEIKGYNLPMIELGTDTNGFKNLKEYLDNLNEKLDLYKQIDINKRRLAEAKYDLEKTDKNIEEIKEGLKTEKQELEGLIKEWDDIKEQLELVNIDIGELDGIGDEYLIIEKKLNNVKENITICKTNIQSRRKKIKEVRYELEELQEAKLKQQYYEEYALWIRDFFINAVKTIEKNILSELYVEFNTTFKNWFDVLIADETKSARLDVDFTPMVEQGGMAQEINYLSGGEKTSVALAYRLALNKLVKKVSVGMETNLLILDEPTDGLSKEQLLRLRDILDQMNCSQIIMVSHEAELEGLADNIMHVEKENGVSKIGEMSL